MSNDLTPMQLIHDLLMKSAPYDMDQNELQAYAGMIYSDEIVMPEELVAYFNGGKEQTPLVASLNQKAKELFPLKNGSKPNNTGKYQATQIDIDLNSSEDTSSTYTFARKMNSNLTAFAIAITTIRQLTKSEKINNKFKRTIQNKVLRNLANFDNQYLLNNKAALLKQTFDAFAPKLAIFAIANGAISQFEAQGIEFNATTRQMILEMVSKHFDALDSNYLENNKAELIEKLINIIKKSETWASMFKRISGLN